MKKQISKFLIIASIFGTLVLPNLSFASTLLKTESLGPTSVTLKAVGLSLNQEVRFTLKNNSTSIAEYSQTVDTKNNDTSGAGSAVASFTGLVANGQYLAMVSDLNTGSMLKTLNFMTPKTSSSSAEEPSSSIVAPVVNVSAGSITATSAKITVKIEKVDSRSFPIKVGLFYGKIGTSAQLVLLDTQNLKSSDIPYTIVVPLSSLESSTKDAEITYSYKVVTQSGSSSWSTDIYNFKTLVGAPKQNQNLPSVISLTTSNLTAVSVTINATGLALNEKYEFKVSGVTISPIKINANADNLGKAQAIFSGLDSNKDYTASISKYDPSTGFPGSSLTTLPFKTPELRTILTISNLTPDSATLNATGLISGVKYEFKISGETIAPIKTESVASEVGVAGGIFNKFLKPNRNYKATVSKIDAAGYATVVVATTSFITPTVLNTVSGSNNNQNVDNNTTEDNTPVVTPPGLTTANGGLVPCGLNGATNCGFYDLLKMVNIIVNFVLFRLAIPIAAVMFAYAGFELITSGGSSEKKTKAKNMFLNVVIGIVLIAAAWLIVHTISSILGYDGSWIGL